MRSRTVAVLSLGSFRERLECSAPGVELKHCPTFSAMEGTSTWSVRVTDCFIDADHVIADPVRPYIARIRAAFILLQTGMGLGVVQGGIDSMWQVEDQLGHVNQFLDDRPDTLQAELDDLTARIETLAATPYQTGNEYLVDVLDVRAHTSELALRAAQSALLHQGARGYLMSALPSDVLPEARDERPWRQFICRACGFIYDEETGDPDGGLAPGTRYEDIPDDWACPLCSVSKHDFDPYSPPVAGSAAARQASHIAPSAVRGRKGVVIIGGGLAGWSVARALRARDADLPITLVAADAADVYPKPALSLAFGHRKTARDLIVATGPEAAHELGVRLVPHAFAVGIDARAKRVRTTRGGFDYGSLVLAMGARPVETRALPADLCWRINALDIWTRLHAVLDHGPRRVAVIGAGLVGCELADDLAHADHAVVVLDPAPRPLAAWASMQESQQLLDAWRKLGVRFVGSAGIRSVTRGAVSELSSQQPIIIACDDGSTFEADVVIAAIGLATDARLARSAGLTFNSGIAVDETTLATSVAAIYSTGDCVSINGKPCRFIEPIARQAEAIARAIVKVPGEATPHRAPLIRLKTRSAPMTLAGSR